MIYDMESALVRGHCASVRHLTLSAPALQSGEPSYKSEGAQWTECIGLNLLLELGHSRNGSCTVMVVTILVVA